MRTEWLGLWAQDRQGFYAGRVIKKADIPKYTRIVLRYNKYYSKDTNRPRFIFCFADSEEYKNRCKPIEWVEEDEQPYYDASIDAYFTENGERLYTYSEVQKAITRCACSVGGDREYGEHLVSDYI